MRQVADTVGEGHSRNQRDDGPDDYVAEVRAQSQFVHHPAEHGGQQAARDGAGDARKMPVTDEQHIDPEHQSGHERRYAVSEAAAEDDAEGRAAERGGRDLLPRGLRAHGADGLQLRFQLLEVALALGDFTGELVDGHHLVEARALDGDEFGAGESFRRGHDAVAEHEKALVVHAVVTGDAPHGLVHARDLRPVLQQDRPGLVGQLHDFAVVVHCHPLFSNFYLFRYSSCWIKPTSKC